MHKKGRLLIGVLFVIILVNAQGCNVSPEEIAKNIKAEEIEKLIVCEEPYMRYGSGCCLDQDNNKVCDSDEGSQIPERRPPIIQPEKDVTSPVIPEPRLPKEEIEVTKVVICAREMGKNTETTTYLEVDDVLSMRGGEEIDIELKLGETYEYTGELNKNINCLEKTKSILPKKVLFDFVEGNPSAIVRAGELIPIKVSVTNNGEADIPKGAAEVRLVGSVLSGLFTWVGVSNKASHFASNTAPLEGIERETDFPDTETITVANIQIPTLGTSSYTTSVTAQLCYPYQTMVEGEDKSNAPVQVSSITERRTSSGIALNLEIMNKGGGEVIKNTEVCATTIPLDKRDRVLVDVDGDYDCTFSERLQSNKGYVVLREGLGRLMCTRVTDNQETSLLDRFRADLRYKYIQEISKTITIENQ